MRALTQSQALMTSALLEWCGPDWWSWVCQEALAVTARKRCTQPDCAPWPNLAPSCWPSNHGQKQKRGKERCCKGRKNVGESKKNRISFLHVTQIAGNSFKGFFPVGFTLIPPSFTSFNWINEQVQPDRGNIYFPGTSYFAEGLRVAVTWSWSRFYNKKGGKRYGVCRVSNLCQMYVWMAIDGWMGLPIVLLSAVWRGIRAVGKWPRNTRPAAWETPTSERT